MVALITQHIRTHPSLYTDASHHTTPPPPPYERGADAPHHPALWMGLRWRGDPPPRSNHCACLCNYADVCSMLMTSSLGRYATKEMFQKASFLDSDRMFSFGAFYRPVTTLSSPSPYLSCSLFRFRLCSLCL